MDEEKYRDEPSEGRELGSSFEEHTSHNLGSSFSSHTYSPPDRRGGPGGRERRNRKWFWIAGILLLLALGVFLIHYYSADSTAAKAGNGRGQQGPAAITVGKTTTGDMNIYVDALGTVTPVSTVTLYSQITGRVIAVHYREGQVVRKGDALIDIDPQPYEATLTEAEGTLERDQGVLAEARIDLQRYKDAFARNAIARQQLEDQEQVVVQDQGTVKTDQGTVAYDKIQLAYCHIVSPINGRVGLRLVDPGNTVFSGSSSTLVVITQLQPITVVFNVSEDSLPEVQAQLHGKQALEVDAFDRANDKQLETGKLTSLNNEVDTTTGTVKFRAEFANRDLSLFPNQFVNARLLVRTLKNATLVPSAAVQHNGTASFVYVVKPDDTVAVQPITTITNNDTETAVEGVVKVSVPQRSGGKKGQGAAGAGSSGNGKGASPTGGNQAP